ncbi:MAG: hypothetical protein HYS12_06530 [Planctomycetes bacterium]|nr:hypothetical protein [Planctomycetota bacterium]
MLRGTVLIGLFGTIPLLAGGCAGELPPGSAPPAESAGAEVRSAGGQNQVTRRVTIAVSGMT